MSEGDAIPVEAFRSRIGSALGSRDYAEVEAAWKEYASLHPDERDYLLGVTEQLTKNDKGALAGELLAGFATQLQNADDAEGAFEMARHSLRASQRTEGLRELLISTYQARHKSNANLDRFLAKSGLPEEGGSMRPQVDALDRYLTFEEGAHVYHKGGWGYGEVVEFDPDEESMVVDFQKRRGHKMNILSATKILKRLPNDHFGVYHHYRREELDALIKDDPAGVFKIFLRSFSGKAQLKKVREAIVPDIMPKEEWSRWWTRAKKAILKDPDIRIGKGSSPLMELRDKAKPIEVEVAEKMRALADGLGQAKLAREYLRNLDLVPALTAAVATVVRESLERVTSSEESRLALLYLLSDLKVDDSAQAGEDALGMIKGTEDLRALISKLELSDRKRSIQAIAEANNPGWTDQVAAMMEGGDVDLADLCLELLASKRPDILINLFTRLSTSPREHPSLFLWYARNFLQGNIPMELVPGESADATMDKLLTLTNQTGLEQKRSGDEGLKEFLRQVRSFLTARRMKLFNTYVETISLDYARFLNAKISRNRGLTDQTKRSLVDVLEGNHPTLNETGRGAQAAGGVPDDVIYTTLRGYHTKEAELRHMVDEEIPENAADLGRAASFGDMSENAEYSAALEKQSFLMGRVAELRSALERARIIEQPEAPFEKVVIGVRVGVRNETRGADESFSILGPWDVDLDRGIISYLSPVGKGLLGRTLNERTEIELPEGSAAYVVNTIEHDVYLEENSQ